MDFSPYFSRLQKFVDPPQIMVLHHTASTTDVSIEEYNQQHIQQGWVCFGPHGLIRKDGTIQYGRPVIDPRDGSSGFIGAQAYGINGSSIGVETAGNFMVEEPDPKQIAAIVQLFSEWATKLPSIKKIIGHRDVSKIIPFVGGLSTATSCPGDHLYACIAMIAENVSEKVGRTILHPFSPNSTIPNFMMQLDGNEDNGKSLIHGKA